MSVIFVRQLAVPFLALPTASVLCGGSPGYKNYFMVLSVEERLWETQVWTEESGFDSRRRIFFVSSEPIVALTSTQPPVQRVPGDHISRAQSCQDTKLITHCPAVLRLRMHGAQSPLFHTCYNTILN